MNSGKFFLSLSFCLLALSACIGQSSKVIVRPSGPQPGLPPQESFDFGNLIESKSGPAGAALPEWIAAFLGGGVWETEALPSYQDTYVFVAENRGISFKALRQWENNFSVVQDFPQLAAARVEKRLTTAASLYPDDEYGEYFEVLVKKVFDAEYSGAERVDSFWLKRKVIISSADAEEAEDSVLPEERYDFFILVVIDKAVFQAKIQELMSGIKTHVPLNQSQAAAVKRIRQILFEGF